MASGITQSPRKGWSCYIAVKRKSLLIRIQSKCPVQEQSKAEPGIERIHSDCRGIPVRTCPPLPRVYPHLSIRLEWLGFVRKIIWTNAGFASLRLIRDEIEYFEPRFDPAVVPIETTDTDVPDGSSHPEVPAPAFRGKFHSVADYHELYKTGQLTPVAVVQALLPLIRRDTSPPGEHSVAWLESRVDLVLAAAEASTLRYKEKRSLGLFDGVPTGIKDEYDLVGYKTTLGSPREYAVEPKGDQPFTSWTVAKMEEAGAIILGKLSLHEYGLGMSATSFLSSHPPLPGLLMGLYINLKPSRLTPCLQIPLETTRHLERLVTLITHTTTQAAALQAAHTLLQLD